MRAWRFHQPGNIENLILEETEMPEPGLNEAVVSIRCAALNPADRYLIQGQYPRAGTPPFTPGRDGAGIVIRPASLDKFKENDAVMILGGLTGISQQGTLAEYCCVPEEWLAPIPPGWSFEEACAAPLVHLTAWRALKICADVKPSEIVLITGASGGVGTAAIFLAKSLGARVIALSRNPEKYEALKSLGADTIISSNHPDLEKEVKKAAADQPISVILETLGGPYLEKCIRIAAPHARIIVLGLLADLTSTITIGLLIHKNLHLQGMSVSAFTAPEAHAAWDTILSLFQKQQKKPVISRVFSMEEVQEAFLHMYKGPLGKVVVRIAPDA